jgi:hypothetical protein
MSDDKPARGGSCGVSNARFAAIGGPAARDTDGYHPRQCLPRGIGLSGRRWDARPLVLALAVISLLSVFLAPAVEIARRTSVTGFSVNSGPRFAAGTSAAPGAATLGDLLA